MAKFFDSPEMREALRRLVRARMAYKGYEYKDLAASLRELGVIQQESNLRSKVNNGSMGAQLFIYILMALDMPSLSLTEVQNVLAEVESSADATAESACG